MKHYQQTVIPARPEAVETTHVKTTCDLCDQPIEPPACYDVNEVTVSHKTGNSYPEGGSGERVAVDLCPSCFTDELIPWLRSRGATTEATTPTEWSW